ncbi:MATE family efflux transporter [Fusobacterium perfoetens]|uniref:MATE family efflux transporter n=1 Tax=Fusobacterium perfoetens TaxID=852 RepID=UPI001F1BD266|nr:MATE family efflux transporter [Fusobacterium perfoetens]MCF2625304.1 MATE family efflux transporter [Fusobacterium perfoetens]
MNCNENKMGSHKILPLLLSMSLPPTISMMTSSLYNIVDSIFVARLGNNALTAVSLAFPIQILIIALAIGLGVGVNSFVSRKLGEKDFSAADSAASHGIFLSVLHYIILSVLGIIFIKPFFNIFTKNSEIFNMGCTYTYIVTFLSFGIIMQIGIEKTLQATGNTLTPMFLQIIGAGTNIILDPIMIYGYFGFPEMGVTGAAVATVCGQIIALLCSLYVIFYKKQEVKISIKNFKWDSNIVKKIYSVAVPSFFIISTGFFMVTGINYILTGISALAVSVFGIYYKLQTFVYMPTSGITQGAMPIMGYNYGAGNKKRLLETLDYSMLICAVINLAGTFLFWIFPKEILSCFNASYEMLEIGVPALKIISISFVAGSICFIFSCFFQALGMGGASLFITLLRQFIILLPLAFFMGNIFGLKGVWWSFIIAEFITCICSIIIYKHHSKKDSVFK